MSYVFYYQEEHENRFRDASGGVRIEIAAGSHGEESDVQIRINDDMVLFLDKNASIKLAEGLSSAMGYIGFDESPILAIRREWREMPCRVGITMDLDRRLDEWSRQLQGMGGIQKWGPFKTKTAAQKRENEIAKSHGCNYHPGGGGPEDANWYVYHFDYTRRK